MKKFKLALIFLALASKSMLAQDEPVQLWESTFFIANSSSTTPVLFVDQDENTYSISSHVRDSINVNGGFVMIKYDSLGNQLWWRTYYSFLPLTWECATVDGAGNIYLGLSQGLGVPIPALEYDAVILKYSPDGHLQWSRNISALPGSDGNIVPEYLAVDDLGRLIVFNYGDDGLEFDVFNNFMLVTCLDTANSNQIWSAKLPEPGQVTVPGILPGSYQPANLTTDGNKSVFFATEYGSDGNLYYHVFQLDDRGKLIEKATKPYTGEPIDFNAFAGDNNLLIGNKNLGHSVTKINIQGDTLWRYEKPNGWISPEGMAGRTLGITEDDSAYVYATGAWGQPSTGMGMITTKLSPDGQLIWENIYDLHLENAYDGGQSIIFDDFHVYAIGGSSNQNQDASLTIIVYDRFSGEEEFVINLKDQNNLVYFGRIIKKSVGGFVYQGHSHNRDQDAQLHTGRFRMPVVSTSSTDPLLHASIAVYPNPVLEKVCVGNIDTDVFTAVRITDAQGRIILSQKIQQTDETLLLPYDMSPGMYLLVLEGRGVMVTRKLIRGN